MGQDQRTEVREAFRNLFLADREKGEPRTLNQYKNLFPGFWDVVDEEFHRFDTRVDTPAAGRTQTSDGRPPGGSVPLPPAPAGNRIGPYLILRELGHGGMGVVHLAKDSRLPRKVALKVLPAHFASSPHLLERFRREASLAARLDHPNICTVYEAGEADGTHYLAMRFVEGKTLSELIQQSKLTGRRVAGVPGDEPPPSGTTSSSERARDLDRMLHLLEKAARALHAAHEKGLLHRDIKPHNIMVNAEEEPVLLDFGLAREESGEGHDLTRTGTLIGTPAYMSPEQLMAQRIPLDRRTDVYSLGVTIYECLTLRLPYEAASTEVLYQMILSTDPEDPRRLNRDLTRDIKVVLETAMAKDRDRRYRTALDLADDLRAVREGEPIRARPASLGYRLSRWSRRNRGVLATVAGTALVAGAGAWALFSGGLGQSPDEVVALGKEYTEKGQRPAARMLYEKAAEKWGKPWQESGKSGSPPPAIARIYDGLVDCLVKDAEDAGLKGDYGESKRLLQRAEAAMQLMSAEGRQSRSTDDLHKSIGFDYFRSEFAWCDLMTRAGKGVRADVDELVKDQLQYEGDTWSTGLLGRLETRLTDPAHPEYGKSVFVLATAASLPRNQVILDWLDRTEKIPPRVVPDVLRYIGSFEEREFRRCEECLVFATKRMAINRAPEHAATLAEFLEKGKPADREGRLGASLLTIAADLPPTGSGGGEALALWMSVKDLDRTERYRRLLDASLSGDGPVSDSLGTWLRNHTGVPDPVEGWGPWWRERRGTDPRLLLARALHVEEDPGSWNPVDIHARLMASGDGERVPLHNLLTLSVPTDAKSPVWNPDASVQPPPEFWTAWTRVLQARFPPRRLWVAHLAMGDWEEVPRVVWSQAIDIRPGETVKVEHSSPLIHPPGLPWRIDFIPTHPVGSETRAYFGFQNPWRSAGSCAFGARVLLDLGPQGASLAWFDTYIQGDGNSMQHGNLFAGEGGFLARESGRIVPAGDRTFCMDELVLACLGPEGAPVPPDPVAAWRPRMAARMTAAADSMERSRAAESGASGDWSPPAKVLEDLVVPASFALLVPLGESTDAMRRITDALRGAKEVVVPEPGSPLRFAKQSLQSRIRIRLLLARLLAGDAGATGESMETLLVKQALSAPAAGWWTYERLPHILEKLTSPKASKEIRQFAAGRVAYSSQFSTHAVDSIEASLTASGIAKPLVRDSYGYSVIRGPSRVGDIVFGLIVVLIAVALCKLASVRGGWPARLRPGIALIAGAILLMCFRLETTGGRTAPIWTSGLAIITLGAWCIALSGTGPARFWSPVLASASLLLEFVDSLGPPRVYRGAPSGLEALAGFVFAVGIILLPGLSAGLAARSPASTAPGTSSGRLQWFRARPFFIQALAFFPILFVAGGLGAAYRSNGSGNEGPFGDMTGFLFLGAGLALWLAWVLRRMWKEAGRLAALSGARAA